MKIKSMLMGALALAFACAFGEEAKELGVNGETVRLCRLDGAGDNGNAAPDAVKTTDVKLPYEVVDGTVVLGNSAASSLRSRRERRDDQKYVTVKISSGELVIPDAIDGIPVRSIGFFAFSGCRGLKSVTIPNGVTSIGDCAFSGCSGLKSVTIPDGVTSIGERAFADCSGITSVAIPDGVTSIEDCAFSGCSGLKSVTIPDSVMIIGNRAFSGCSGLKSVTIPNSVTIIGCLAFSECSGLTEVTMLGKRPAAPNDIFKRCGNLKSIHVPANAKGWVVMKEWLGIPLVYDRDDCPKEQNPKSSSIEIAAKLLPESLSAGLEESLVGYWPFDGNANDATKYRNNGMLHDVTPAEDRHGNANKAYRFNGSSYIEVPHSETLNMTHAITMTAWIKPHNWWSNPRARHLQSVDVMQKGDRGNCNYQFSMFRDNAILSGLNAGTKDAGKKCEKLGLELNKWQQVALTYESGKSLCFYRDGALVGKWPCSQDLQPNKGSLFIGYDPFGDPEYFIGDMDDVRLFNRALSEQEIKDLYKAEAPNQNAIPQVDDGTAETTDVKLPYEVVDGAVVLGNGAARGLRSRRERRDDQKYVTVKISSGELVIPDAIDGMPVRRIGSGAFSDCKGLASVTIPDGVTSIWARAFDGCNDSLFDTTTILGVKLVDGWAVGNTGYLSGDLNLTGARGIADYAFSGCSGLASVTIPDSVTSIGAGAFSGCKSLESVTIPYSVTNIGRYAFAGRQPTTLENEFAKFSGLKSFSVSSDNPSYSSRNGMLCTKDGSVLIVGVNGDVVVPEGVTSIGDCAFYGCSGLTSVVIPNSVTNIGERAFTHCSGLTSVAIPDGVTNIGWGAFCGCSGLTSVAIPDGVTNIGWEAFCCCSGLKSVLIPNGVTIVGDWTFASCTNLTSVTIPNGVTSIGDGAFASCINLTDVTIPNSVENIGERAFDGCSGLTSVSILNGVTSIGDGAFASCINLTDVTIPNSVENIGERAFSDCSGLKSVSIPSYVERIDVSAFDGCNELLFDTTTIPGVKLVDGWAVEGTGSLYGDLNLVGVRGIASGAFCDCTNLTSVAIPDGVTSIVRGAFYGCSSLTNVTIGNGVTSIESHAFDDCSSLTSVTIPDSVKNIGSRAFIRCFKLSSVDVMKEGKVEKVSFQDFCKQWKLVVGGLMLPGFRRGLRPGSQPVSGGSSLRERRALREAARKEEQQREETLKAERKAQREKAEAERRAREGK